MAELSVGIGQQYKTLDAAHAASKSGDTVIVHPGVYKDNLSPKAGVTWRGLPGAALDGGWAWATQKVTEDEAKANQVLINQPDVSLIGFEIRNVRGKGVNVAAGGDRFLMENCYIHHTANGGMGSNGTGTPIHGVTIRNCRMEYLSMTGQWYETPVNGCCLHRHVIGLRVENLSIRYGYGEGFALGPGTRDVEVRGLSVGDTKHLGAYGFNRAAGILFEDCVLYQTGDPEWRQGDGHVGSGFVFGDEVSGYKWAKGPRGDDAILRRCITINTGGCVEIRNQRKTAANGNPDGYDTRPDSLLIENCTFIAGPDTRRGVIVAENEWGGKVHATFRKNLFVLDRMADGGPALRSNADGVRFDDNAWSGGVPASLPGSNRPVAASALVAPFATLDGALNLDNYRPVAGGPLDGAGYGALGPLPVEPPPPDDDPPPDPPDGPEPPLRTPDWDALIEQAAAVGVQLAVQAEANRNRWALLEELRKAEAVFSLALDQATAELGELLLKLDEYKQAAESGEE